MDYVTIILKAAKMAKVSGALLLAICTHESRLENVMVPNDGGSPTYGICQVKLGTAQMLGYKGDAQGLMDPKTNAKWAAQYLKRQKLRYDGDWYKAVAAYNAGTYNESSRVPGCAKNRKYVNRVKSKLKEELQDRLECDTVKE